ncbi:MAG: 3-phosphoglycerate dehydrogenase [Oscillospiraceae bacterium]|jgi:D-3-phosphoglycerate dehydrogenase|nr:3-phosphoglycerate dehydrogenase [Oscillospiraceae bacterium]
MFNVKTLNKISKTGLAQLDGRAYKCSDDAENPDAILVRSAKMHDYEMNRELSCIIRAGAGTNNIPVDKCSEEGIVVFNTPGANANAVKELVICALILSSRDICGAIDWARTLKGKGGEVGALVEKGKSAFVGPEIAGKTIGVIGLGAIGVMVANAAVSLGMTALGYDPYLSVDAAWGLSRAVGRALDLKTIYEQCDYITLHVPYNKETAAMINESSIGMMKDEVRIINLARGELVNSADMLAALARGKVGRYVTDFPDDLVIGEKNVIALPHLGASTPESEENCAEMAVSQMIDFLENGNIKNSVNYPDVYAPREGAARVCITHLNVPKIISAVSTAFSAVGINISNFINKSKGNYAYSILDIDSKADDSVFEELRKVKGIQKIRVIQ